MREILFRAKNIHSYNGEPPKWEYGGIILTDNDASIVNAVSTNFSATPVDRNTIGQFTGLYDLNDKAVYEGDIISAEYETKKEIVYENFKIRWNDSCAGFIADNPDGWEFLDELPLFRVIGNIHDNSEILRATKIKKSET